MSADSDHVERLETLELAEAKRNGDVERMKEIYGAKTARLQAQVDAAKQAAEEAEGEAAKDKATRDHDHAVKVAAERLSASGTPGEGFNPQQEDIDTVVAELHRRRGWKVEPRQSGPDLQKIAAEAWEKATKK